MVAEPPNYVFYYYIMGKVTSLQGKATGKVGSMVYSVSGGQMIAREYQPNVANPSTQLQVDQRAKMKLMSQVAAALAPVIAIPKEGLKSSRNLFIKKNFENASASEGVAQVTYENLQLTNGNAGLPAIQIHREAASGVSVNLEERCDAAVTRVVYILYRKTSEATLQYVQSVIVNAPGGEGKFPGTLVYTEGDIVVFAYGMKDLNARATAKYSDYNVKNGEDIATLTLTRRLSLSDYQFTQTRGTTLFAGETDSVVVGDNQARVFVTALGKGSVAGAGVFDLGTQVTVTATPGDNATFVGWRNNGANAIISTDAAYTFTLEGTADLVAVFQSEDAPIIYNINVTKPAGIESISITNNGKIRAGQSCTLQATMAAGIQFGGWWKDGNDLLSWENPYTFTPSESMNITPQVREGGEG